MSPGETIRMKYQSLFSGKNKKNIIILSFFEFTQRVVKVNKDWQGNFFIQKVLIFFLFLHKNICCGYSLEVPWQGISNESPQYMFSRRNKKNIFTWYLQMSGWVSGWHSQTRITRHRLPNSADDGKALHCTQPFYSLSPCHHVERDYIKKRRKTPSHHYHYTSYCIFREMKIRT